MKEKKKIIINSLTLITFLFLAATIVVNWYSSYRSGDLRDYLNCKEAPGVCERIYPEAAKRVKEARIKAKEISEAEETAQRQ